MISDSFPQDGPCTRTAESAPLPTAGVFRILVCRATHSLGNTLLLTPLIKELQTVYPGAEIDIVTRTPVGADIFGRFQNVRRIFCLPSRPFLHPVRYLAVLSKLRQ